MSALKRLGIRHDVFKKSAYSGHQAQTEKTFSFKWSKRETYESEAVKEHARNWLIERYCAGDKQVLERWLAGGKKIILDAGCGAGFSALLLFADRLKKHDYLGVDISDACWVAKQRFTKVGIRADFMKCSLLELPVPDESIDIIFCEGVLHHTDSTETSLKTLAGKLKSGGRFLFYVYARKAVIREFTDDFIREKLKNLSDEEAWKALEPLSKLGMALGRLDVELEVGEDIPYLGIKKGKVDLQRFFYWNICKLYYRPELTLDEMNHVNFDWFRPLNCHRHTPEQIESWCRDSGLYIEHMNVQEAGITVVAVKRAK